jgi:hypothetical protein
MADVDWGSVEDQLKQQAGQWYDPSMLGDVQRNSSYGAGDSPDMSSVNDWVSRVAAKSQLRDSNEVNSTYVPNGEGGVTVGPTGTVNDPNKTGLPSGQGVQGSFSAPQGFASQWSSPSLTGAQWGASTAASGPSQDQIDTKAKSDALYQRLLADSQQSLNIDPSTDPNIRVQADAYSANEERARRNYLSDAAEGHGQFANMDGERRMAAERMGQRTGSFEAGLVGSELTARRAAIQDRLHSMQGMLSAEQVQELQHELALMDNGIREKQVAAGIRGQDLNQDQFLRELALREWNDHDTSQYNWTFGR